ncbi:MAG: Rpn family recombination-promoting nuclease/putative transposase [Burkholderiales bacterium]|nr:Rpn family recombination-promoting nuclease/putative transposase [Burkholderiales bacterium]
MLLDPKNDFVFKRLFANAPALAADLINAVRSDQPPVAVVEVLNPRIDPAELTGKFIVLDVLARDADGVLYGIEMQMRRHPHWHERSAYYLARAFANQLRNGDNYDELRQTIGIHLMDFELFDDPAQAHWRFELRDRDRPVVMLTPALQLNLIELPKLDRLRTDGGALAAWAAYFEHWQEDALMSTITHAPVQQALQELAQLSADEEAQRLAFVRERAMRDEAAFMKAAREEGMQEGREEGRQEGRQEGRGEGRLEARRELACRLFEQPGLDEAAIAHLTQLSEDEVRQLRRR